MTAASGRPLLGRVVMVTRPRREAEPLVTALEARGAIPLLAPAISIVPAAAPALDRALAGLWRGDFEWVVLTSRAGAEAVAARVAIRGLDPGTLPARVAAVGDGTATALRRRGIEPAIVPPSFTTAALGRAMPRGRGRVLLPRADIAPTRLESALAAKGWTPVRVDAYRTKLSDRLPPDAARALGEGPLDAVTFTSASTVLGFMRMAGPMVRGAGGLRGAKVVCIGPVTARAAREAGLPVAATARPHTIEGLIAAVERALEPPKREES